MTPVGDGKSATQLEATKIGSTACRSPARTSCFVASTFTRHMSASRRSSTATMPARCSRPSTPSSSAATAVGSATSPSTTSTFSASMPYVASGRVASAGCSNRRTWCPARSRAATDCAPTYPVPPVTPTSIRSTTSGCEAGLGQADQRDPATAGLGDVVVVPGTIRDEAGPRRGVVVAVEDLLVGPEQPALHPDEHLGVGAAVGQVEEPSGVGRCSTERRDDDALPTAVPPERQGHLVLVAAAPTDGAEKQMLHTYPDPRVVGVGRLHHRYVLRADLDDLLAGGRLELAGRALTCRL